MNRYLQLIIGLWERKIQTLTIMLVLFILFLTTGTAHTQNILFYGPHVTGQQFTKVALNEISVTYDEVNTTQFRELSLEDMLEYSVVIIGYNTNWDIPNTEGRQSLILQTDTILSYVYSGGIIIAFGQNDNASDNYNIKEEEGWIPYDLFLNEASIEQGAIFAQDHPIFSSIVERGITILSPSNLWYNASSDSIWLETVGDEWCPLVTSTDLPTTHALMLEAAYGLGTFIISQLNIDISTSYRSPLGKELMQNLLNYALTNPTYCPLEVLIDIKPGDNPNCINNNGKGVIPVAILGKSNYSVYHIDPTTIKLENLAVKVSEKNNKWFYHYKDVNLDQLDDLIVQFDGILENGDGEANLTGKLYDNTPIFGTDTICIVP